MHILHVVGARPNFMKAAPMIATLREYGIQQTVVHTGQHYDASMSDVFFEQLGMPAPDVNLAVGSRSHGAQTADVMARFEPVVLDYQPDVVLVYGDVNSTAAAALVCSKLLVPVGHVEAGLRSFDRSMPEEINRIVTDHLADYLFTPSADADVNLMKEGIDSQKIFCVGNVMIDTLVRLLPKAKAITRDDGVFDAPYALVTLHRPANVDDPETLTRLLRAIAMLSRDIRVVFPVHPRTRARMEALPHWNNGGGVTLIDPAGYLDFLALQLHSELVVTDSGGIQEETTYLGVPCITMRPSTERPVTTVVGTNVLTGSDPRRMLAEARRVLAGERKRGSRPPLWDGCTAMRIADVLVASHVERQPVSA
jgi:UDP-N-acetylglucosamine 2-epimerase (non-hydrolysing)